MEHLASKGSDPLNCSSSDTSNDQSVKFGMKERHLGIPKNEENNSPNKTGKT